MKELTLEELEKLNSQRKGEITKEKAAYLARRKEIMKLHLVDKLPMATIGKRFGMSRQRIHQIINNYY